MINLFQTSYALCRYSFGPLQSPYGSRADTLPQNKNFLQILDVPKNSGGARVGLEGAMALLLEALSPPVGGKFGFLLEKIWQIWKEKFWKRLNGQNLVSFQTGVLFWDIR